MDSKKPQDPAKPLPSAKPKQNPDDSGELNSKERAILDSMKSVKRTTIPTKSYLISEDKDKPKWAPLSIGQDVVVAGFSFKISHISKGFLILESDSSKQEEIEEELKEEVWKRLKASGPRSLLRIDGTPLYVETRILTAVEESSAAG